MRTLALKDRVDAGRRLAILLRRYKDNSGCVVVALPRGGVPVAYEIAAALGLPLEAYIVKKIVRKLGVRCQTELAIGAMTRGGLVVLNEDVIRARRIAKRTLGVEIERALKELKRRERVYRNNRPFPSVAGRTVIVVDDGVSSGATLKAAIQALRAQGPLRIVAAVGVAPRSAASWLSRVADEVVVLLQPEPFETIGQCYQEFPEVTDQEVQALLLAAQTKSAGPKQTAALA